MRGLLLALIGALIAMTAAQGQVGYTRRGEDYARFKVPSGDPAVCSSRCEHEARCRAWNFSYPRTASVAALCSLKTSVPPPLADACCVSGVRGAGIVAPRLRGVEFGIDRLGGDYRSFDMPAEPDGASCEIACKGDNRCRAFTYVRPGYIGASARCYLKDKIKPPRRKPCCVSGVVR